MAATLDEGETVLENAAIEPEIADLAHLLIKMGAQIEGVGTSRLVIHVVKKLHGGQHRVIADRIETGTFLCAAASVGGDIILRHTLANMLHAVLEKMSETGAQIQIGDDWIRLQMDRANGNTTSGETIFENRFMHGPELNRLGARIVIDGHTAHIVGMPELSGETVIDIFIT
ncbi:hypothetical protein ACTFIZ_000234 [Dictyostelium cf. discoideum]